MAKPLFIVFEGIDGCGKSTQLQKLAANLQKKGRAVFTTAEPTEGPTGKQLREALSGKTSYSPCGMAALFTLDRICHNKSIEEELAAGRDVISDRYYYSSLAYQGSLCDYKWVRHMNCECPEIRHPDLCIFLDIPPRVALSRINARGESKEIYEKEESLTLFRETFLKVFSTLSDRVAVIDATGTPEEVEERIIASVEALIAEKEI